MSIEDVLRTIIRQELSLDQAVRVKREGSAKSRLYELAQEIVNEVKPGETVREVLINVNSAEPITEVIEQAKELLANAPKPKKTVYTVIFNGSERTWPSKEISNNEFDSLKDAVSAMEKVEGRDLYCQYFIERHEVDV